MRLDGIANRAARTPPGPLTGNVLSVDGARVRYSLPGRGDAAFVGRLLFDPGAVPIARGSTCLVLPTPTATWVIVAWSGT